MILKLGNAISEGETGKLGYSTVDGLGENPDNSDMFNLWKGWAASLRATVSKIAKELFMNEQSSTDPGTTNKSTLGGENSKTFQESIWVCLTKYAVFDGRASRSEFWWFSLFIALVGGALAYLSQNLSDIFLIAILLPFLAVGTRRLRDSGKSPWLQFYLLVPIAGIIILAFWWVLPSTNDFLEEDSLPA